VKEHAVEPDLSGQIALVTGASRGIGAELAKAIAGCGALVVCTARAVGDGSPGTLAGTVAAIEAAGGRAEAVPAEITDPAACEGLVSGIIARHGRLDILVNNAGIYPRGPLATTSPDDWDALMAVNVNAVFDLCHFASIQMQAQRYGRIVNVSSYIGSQVYPDRLAYAVSKALLDRLSYGLAREVMGDGVQVVSWAPGLTATEMTDGRGEPVEAVVPSFLWLLGQEPTAFTGRKAEKRGFGETWGPGIAIEPLPERLTWKD
jgi:NAD(P)-dependent dehydrogenase (short-subunit alcohol dehydrogenase family)